MTLKTEGTTLNLSSEITPSDAVSNVTATASASKNGYLINSIQYPDVTCHLWKEDIIKVLHNLAGQTALQNQILANQEDAMVTMANETIMSIYILTIRASHCPFYECKQKKIIKKIRKKKKNSR
ncbi:uncharacterized protein VP01_7019g1 [Puccinia sorghi]|uniref:Uncharacterized protein n=1 Tax=Puccinia sorghi TaxID=27349 RepID=A0A0L6UDR0_9BASI|nr:uncharacterized protein VP01_7019g1 [Puccinia sorghi]